MKKGVIFSIILICTAMLSGCKSASGMSVISGVENEINTIPDTIRDTIPDIITDTESTEAPADIKTVEAVQGGPYGRISITLPEGWSYELKPVDNDSLTMGLYGIWFYPDDVSDGYIEVNYSQWFGVCGTGLSSEKAALAGNPVNIGTYDGHPYWDFISFEGDYKGIVALTFSVEDWWETYKSQVMEILETIRFDTNEKEGGAYIYNAESELDEIGVSLSLKNISPTGAVLVLNQYRPDAPTGKLQHGSDFILEVEKNGVWEEVPIVVEGDYAFNAAAYLIPNGETSEMALDWEWLYGTLAPGNYRIRKQLMDFRAAGDFDKYTVSAYFVLN